MQEGLSYAFLSGTEAAGGVADAAAVGVETVLGSKTARGGASTGRLDFEGSGGVDTGVVLGDASGSVTLGDGVVVGEVADPFDASLLEPVPNNSLINLVTRSGKVCFGPLLSKS